MLIIHYTRTISLKKQTIIYKFHHNICRNQWLNSIERKSQQKAYFANASCNKSAIKWFVAVQGAIVPERRLEHQQNEEGPPEQMSPVQGVDWGQGEIEWDGKRAECRNVAEGWVDRAWDRGRFGSGSACWIPIFFPGLIPLHGSTCLSWPVAAAAAFPRARGQMSTKETTAKNPLWDTVEATLVPLHCYAGI